MKTCLYPFDLSFEETYSRFSFMTAGEPVKDFHALISLRSQGNMIEQEVRNRFFTSLGIEPSRVFACKQVHSDNIVIVDRQTLNIYPEGDGMITRDQDLILSVVIADCLPVFLYDTENGVFALVHTGWRGTEICLKAVNIMKEEWNSRPEKIAAILGPSIRECCYNVDEERARYFETTFGIDEGEYPLGAVIRREESCENGGGDTFYINLQAANAHILAKAGVRNIAFCRDCTFTDERLGSFRREGEAYTRMTALLGKF